MSEVTVYDDNAVISALEASHYAGQLQEDIARVVKYCQVNKLDPFLKPVHIVPMRVKKPGTRDYEWRNVLMPGIADYRIKAARSGEYAGKTEPEFGPNATYELSGQSITVPEWCRMTIYRMVGGEPRAFTAKEYWIENYATQSRENEAPNAMWSKRSRGQLAKCTEAQALRMAFPEFSGGAPTAEEMEGKTIDGEAREIAPPPKPVHAAPEPSKETPEQAAERGKRTLLAAIQTAENENALHDLRGAPKTQTTLDWMRVKFPDIERELSDAFTKRFNDFMMLEPKEAQ